MLFLMRFHAGVRFSLARGLCAGRGLMGLTRLLPGLPGGLPLFMSVWGGAIGLVSVLLGSCACDERERTAND